MLPQRSVISMSSRIPSATFARGLRGLRLLNNSASHAEGASFVRTDRGLAFGFAQEPAARWRCARSSRPTFPRLRGSLIASIDPCPGGSHRPPRPVMVDTSRRDFASDRLDVVPPVNALGCLATNPRTGSHAWMRRPPRQRSSAPPAQATAHRIRAVASSNVSGPGLFTPSRAFALSSG